MDTPYKNDTKRVLFTYLIYTVSTNIYENREKYEKFRISIKLIDIFTTKP